MALSTITETYGLDDCKIFEVTADSSSSYTCGSAIDIDLVKGLKLDMQIDSKELSGDNIIAGLYSKIMACDFTIEAARMNLDAFNLLFGGNLVASGTTPNQKQTLSILDSDSPKYFQLQGLINGTDSSSSISSCRLVLMKCKISSCPLAFAQNDIATFSMGGKAVFTNKTFSRNSKTKKILMDIILSETAETIAAITS